ncbi:hypothetical protein CDD82_3024 [Ophiocordyceps australis]|uniref:MARVEL domain-containing protein n=1 Tax=Ophiocordyceps australis TaxID=1399860 RepID=A0A2C5XU16_9HYPO|nr:hypothetical protein CDD82_3024 [Ophiocordyceps australis]
MALALSITTILYAALAVFLVIELGLTAYIVSPRATWWGASPSQFNFMLFNTIWSMLALAYLALAPVFFPRLLHRTAALALLAVTTVFWFAGSIAMAAFVGAPECHGGGACSIVQSAQAAVAFGFFIWAGFMALSVLDGLSFWRGGGARVDRGAKPTQQPYPGV